jgi:hypothetical protein
MLEHLGMLKSEWANGGAQLIARSLQEELPVSNNWVAAE